MTLTREVYQIKPESCQLHSLCPRKRERHETSVSGLQHGACDIERLQQWCHRCSYDLLMHLESSNHRRLASWSLWLLNATGKFAPPLQE